MGVSRRRVREKYSSARRRLWVVTSGSVSRLPSGLRYRSTGGRGHCFIALAERKQRVQESLHGLQAFCKQDFRNTSGYQSESQAKSSILYDGQRETIRHIGHAHDRDASLTGALEGVQRDRVLRARRQALQPPRYRAPLLLRRLLCVLRHREWDLEQVRGADDGNPLRVGAQPGVARNDRVGGIVPRVCGPHAVLAVEQHGDAPATERVGGDICVHGGLGGEGLLRAASTRALTELPKKTRSMSCEGWSCDVQRDIVQLDLGTDDVHRHRDALVMADGLMTCRHCTSIWYALRGVAINSAAGQLAPAIPALPVRDRFGQFGYENGHLCGRLGEIEIVPVNEIFRLE
ncbi:hypothetical protein C8Q72DRAFT_442045 [Fomitopsis betulina]|nr:hypothetical protein C8Q72DRAFT_442045 [Fomitopsis betulina]